MSRVLGIAVAEIILDEAQVVAAIGERESAGMPERMGMDVPQVGSHGGRGDDVIDGLTGERLAALGDEEPRQMIAARGQPALYGAQLVAGDRLLEQNDEWAVQRARYMTLETISLMSDDPLISLPAVAR